jgi:plasmid stabilization system protein ParE
MKFIYEQQFKEQLKAILDFISRDNPHAARSFRNNLKGRLEQLQDYPYTYRKSIYFDDNSICDLIFLGYTVIYRVTTDEIRVLDMFKWQG